MKLEPEAVYHSDTKGVIKIADMNIAHIDNAIKRIESVAVLLKLEPNEYPGYIDLVEHQAWRKAGIDASNIKKEV